jgi:hypothetical protein
VSDEAVKLAATLDAIAVDSKAPIAEVDESISEHDSVQGAPVFWARFDEVGVSSWNPPEGEAAAPIEEVQDTGTAGKPD